MGQSHQPPLSRNGDDERTSVRRRAIAVTATVLVFGAFSVVALWRFSVWQSAGWTGVAYVHVPESVLDQSTNGGAPTRRGTAEWPVRTPGTIYIWAGSPAADTDLQPGDVLVSVNGVRAGSPQLSVLDAQLTAGDTVRYEISRDGRPRVVSLTLRPRVETLTLTVAPISSALVSLLFAGIGLAIFWLRPLDGRALVIFLFCGAAALHYQFSILMALDGLAFYRGIQPIDILSPPLLSLMFGLFAVYMGMGALLLHLALIFPRKRPFLQERPRAWWWIYFVPLALVVCCVFLLVAVMMAGGPRGMRSVLVLLGLVLIFLGVRGLRSANQRFVVALADQPGRGLILLCAALLTAVMLPELMAYAFGLLSGFLESNLGIDTDPAKKIFMLVSFIPILLSMVVVAIVPLLVYPFLLCAIVNRSYRDAGPEEKRQVRWPLWGLAIGVGAGAVVRLGFWIASVLAPVTQKSTLFLLSWELSGKLLVLIIPVSFAFAILKYRLMEIDIVIRKTVLYTIVTGATALLYLALVGGVGRFVVSATGIENQTMTIISTLTVAVVFVPLRNGVQTLIDRTFYRRKHDLPELHRQLNHRLAELDATSIPQAAVDGIQGALQLRSVVLFIAGDDGVYRPGANIGPREEQLRRIHITEGGELLDAVSRSPRTWVRNLPANVSSEFERLGAEAVLAIPQRGVIRHLYVLGRKLSDEPLETAELDFVHDIGEYVLVLLDNLRLRDDESDFQKAAAIQRTLLPEEVPDFPRLRVAGTYRPSKIVSGDYYDVLALSSTRAAISIGDVAGKGMPAALLMSSVQATVKALAREASSTGLLCGRVRDVIVNMLSGGKFITFFYCILDEEEGSVSWTNAGHNPPVLLRREGEVHRLEGGGPVFARLFRNQPFETCSMEFRPGDRLMLFTDGAVEIQNDVGEELGEPGLIELMQKGTSISIDTLPGWLIARVSEYCNGELSDDVTIVVVEFAV